MYEELVNEIIEGRRLGKEDDLTFLIDGDLESLCQEEETHGRYSITEYIIIPKV